jgi:hypothetical protein
VINIAIGKGHDLGAASCATVDRRRWLMSISVGKVAV